jgi:hypothetical protein
MDFPFDAFHASLTPDERLLVDRLDSPEAIQSFLTEEVRYNFESDGDTARGPLEVLRRREAHCFEGAIFAGALFWRQGIDPLLVLLEAPQDFDHNLIIYTRQGKYGCVSQSRHAKLRGKPPVYASLRDLAMSYYPDYTSDWTNDPNELTLRGFSQPIDLRRYGTAWVTASEVWDIYHTFIEGVPLEKLFPESEADRIYYYPEEHLRE